MNITLTSAPLCGSVRAPSSKSQLHRLLIAAALGSVPVRIGCNGLSDDICATAACLCAMGAEIELHQTEITVHPISRLPAERCILRCGESGSTLRFLLPLCGALGLSAAFVMEGRLPQRPLAPLDAQLCAHGMRIAREGALLHVDGQLQSGAFTLAGNVSSQYITGFLLSLPLLRGESTLRVTGTQESAPYIAMTEAVLAAADIQIEKTADTWRIFPAQRYMLPPQLRAEGDWSSAAALLCMGALSPDGVRVCGLSSDSRQGDREIVRLLREFGASVTQNADTVTVRRGALHGITIDAAQIPDLVPALAALAASAAGTTEIINAARLRLKESDRLAATTAMLRALGADITERPDGLVIRGKTRLSGGTADACGDHRIAMAAAVAACACDAPVTVCGAQSVQKSYSRFWEDLAQLKGATL